MKFLKTISVLMKALSYKSALNFKCQNHFLTSDCRFLPWYFFSSYYYYYYYYYYCYYYCFISVILLVLFS